MYEQTPPKVQDAIQRDPLLDSQEDRRESTSFLHALLLGPVKFFVLLSSLAAVGVLSIIDFSQKNSGGMV